MSELKFKFKMPDDETLAKYIPIKGEKGEKGDPTKLSQLENDTNFVPKNTTELENYYTKAQTDNAIDADVQALETELGVPDGFFTNTSESVTGEGSAFTLNGTANAIFNDIKLYGDTRQDGTPTPDEPVDAETVTGTQTIIITDSDQHGQSYTISLGDIELCKIGDYQDYIYKSNGGWYVHKELNKVMLGDYTYSNYANTTIYINNASALFGIPTTSGSLISLYSNLFTGSMSSSVQWRFFYNQGVDHIDFRGDSDFCAMNPSQAKQWFTDNSAYMIYPLASPTDSQITDSALISQLEALAQACSYKGTTVIACSGSLPTILSVEAFKNNWSGTVAGINDELAELGRAATNTHLGLVKIGEGLEIDQAGKLSAPLDSALSASSTNAVQNNAVTTAINGMSSRLNLLDNRKFILLGDSYCEGWTPDGNVESWAVKLKNKMGLTNSNCTIAYHGGYGFGNPNAYFSTVLDGLAADSDVTDIVVCGGYNDKGASYSSILTGMQAFANVANTKFPNAKIHVGFIGFSKIASHRNDFRTRVRDYIRACTEIPQMSYLANVEYSLKLIYQVFASDGYHPNNFGQTFIAENVKNALLSGSADSQLGFFGMQIEADSRWDNGTQDLDKIGTSVNNGLTTIECTANKMVVVKTNTVFDWTGNITWIDVGTIKDGAVVGNNFNSVVIPTHLVLCHMVDGVRNYKNVQGFVRFEAGKMQVAYYEASGTNYVTTNSVRDVQIGTFSGSFNSLFC